MASAFAHATAALALAVAFRPAASTSPSTSPGPADAAAAEPPAVPARWWLLMVACALVPDADVLAFAYGIPYEHVLGHRGITHSLAAAVVIGLLASAAMPRALWPRRRGRMTLGLTLSAASHGLLDAMTTGGLGVAFLAPFSAGRWFLPWRPILVSPIGLSRVLSQRGAEILLSEALWVGLPSLALVGVAEILRRAARHVPRRAGRPA